MVSSQLFKETSHQTSVPLARLWRPQKGLIASAKIKQGSRNAQTKGNDQKKTCNSILSFGRQTALFDDVEMETIHY